MKRILLTAFCLCALVLPSFACGASVTGKVSVKGNEPFTAVYITDESTASYKVKGKFEQELRKNYQGKTVTVKGTVTNPKDGELGTAEIVVTSIND